MPELAPQEVADPASDQIRTRPARPTARDTEPKSDHSHDVHGNGGKNTHNHANKERTAFHHDHGRRTNSPKNLPEDKQSDQKVGGDFLER